MDMDSDILILAGLVMRRKKQRRRWRRDIVQRREEQGFFNNLILEMRLNDTESFFNFFRMTPSRFDQLLNLVGPSIEKKFTFFRSPVSSAERLSVAIRYLASGDSMTSLSYSFRLGVSTISAITNEVCAALWNVLMPLYLPVPSEEKWRDIAAGFDEQWQFPNCLGAIDGKHIVMQAPKGSGSSFFNYKSNFSIIFLAVCDARYRFTIVDIGGAGRQSDGGVFSNSAFGQHMLNGSLQIPAERPVPLSSNNLLPHVFAADEAFPLKNNLMRPYAKRMLTDEKRIFNYRLSRARRVIENAFGIMASRFRIFRKPIIANIETIENIVRAAVCLHNFLKIEDDKSSNSRYSPAGYADFELNGIMYPGQWRSLQQKGLLSLRQTSSNMHSKKTSEIRDKFCDYFNSDGALSWQLAVIKDTN